MAPKRRRTEAERLAEDNVAAPKRRAAPAAPAPAPTPAPAPAPTPAPTPAPAIAAAANTEEQAAQVLAAQAAGFGPHQALQITGVTQTPELNGLICQMEDLRKHQAPPDSAPPCLSPCLPVNPSRILSHLPGAQEQARPGPRAHHRERGRHRRRQQGRHAARP